MRANVTSVHRAVVPWRWRRRRPRRVAQCKGRWWRHHGGNKHCSAGRCTRLHHGQHGQAGCCAGQHCGGEQGARSGHPFLRKRPAVDGRRRSQSASQNARNGQKSFALPTRNSLAHMDKLKDGVRCLARANRGRRIASRAWVSGARVAAFLKSNPSGATGRPRAARSRHVARVHVHVCESWPP